ncbi:TetR/AcrR family transcriptional regulator [Ktedonosporobacter rubrisoli]|uniref:TetR/AcrR family transcriptional regulator n=1 Tax=Ktedonosporobacter rubrisoli TaxID=2509675 RepID=A0A4P6JK32_KTERU|nr:TetR/AcrR family transcriptional regulator [Ktedonosporobacter rubrisoli]QBD75320.1 TetR/AcrR family transcriptional regulator [Ktedonosporobacter rubrisoli]
MAKTKQRIIAEAIRILATSGYAQFSIGEVATALGVSKGVIHYHFPEKTSLLRAIVEDFYQRAAEYMGAHMRLDTSAAEVLRSYIETNLTFVAENRTAAVATTSIILNARDREGNPIFQDTSGDIYQPLIEIFTYGQQIDGSFRKFDRQLMATILRSAIDTAAQLVLHNSAAENAALLQEIVTTFDLATRRNSDE